MRKFLYKILAFIIIFNTISFVNLSKTYAIKGSDLNLQWHKENVFNDTLEIIQRPEKSEEALLSFDIEKHNGTNAKDGTYTLSYHIADGKEVELIVKKNGSTSLDVEYKTTPPNNNNPVPPTNSNVNNMYNGYNKLLVYDQGSKQYKEANRNNFPTTDPNFQISGINGNRATKVKFKIKKDTGFNFKYRGNTVKFAWKNGSLLFSTDGIEQGNIYGFDLSFRETGTQPPNNKTDTLKIFTGIKRDTFVSTPKANGGKGSERDPVDHSTQRPITSFVGDNPELELSFEMIKEYNTNTKKFDYITTPANSDKDTKVILNLTSLDPSKTLQITLDNIYATPLNPKSNFTNLLNVTAIKSGTNDRITLTLQNKPNIKEEDKKIVPGMIYNSVKIDAVSTTSKKDQQFEALSTNLDIGSVYTYPKYSIIALGPKEFYIKFTPYKGYNGNYTIMQGAGILEKWADHEEKNQGNEDVIIAIPLTLENSSSVEKLFRIDFQFNPATGVNTAKTLQSQVLKYKAFEQDIVLSNPETLEVLNTDIIKTPNSSGVETANLFVTFKWDIGFETVVQSLVKNNDSKDLPIKYTFYENLKPEGTFNEFIGATVVAKSNKTYEVKEAKKTDGTSYTGEFVEGKVTKRIENISGKNNEVLQAEAKFKIPVSDKNNTAIKLQLQYPNIYFIYTNGSYEIKPNAGTSQKYETGKSTLAPLTLNGLLTLYPTIPQNLAIVENSVTNTEFKVKFDEIRYKKENDLLYDYYNKIIKNNNLDLKDKSVKFNIYVSQNKENLDNILKNNNGGKNKHLTLPENVKNKIKVYDFNDQSINKPIDFSTKDAQSKKYIDHLRDGNIVLVSKVKQDTTMPIADFINLDENQVYYITIETVVVPTDKSGKYLNDKVDFSRYSNLISVTTLKNSLTPEENEKIPSAPTKFVGKDVSLSSVNLLWDKVSEVPDADQNSSLEYEFIKIKGEELNNKIFKSNLPIEQIWEKLSDVKNKTAFKTSASNILEFKNGSFVTTNNKDYEYKTNTAKEGEIIDKTLSPNQIYFYYIRTIRVSNGKTVARSVWVPLSITTKNVDGPSNLKVEKSAEFDKKTEVVISFQIPNINVDLIGSEYELKYSLRKDGNPWSDDITMEKSDLSFSKVENSNRIKVTYKIKGLVHSTLYSIRVRIFNKTLNTYSAYSNEVDHRTDVDFSKNDYDSEIDDWETAFKNLVEKLKKQPYWSLEPTSSNTNILYRTGYFDNLTYKAGSIINLETGQGFNKQYYLPAKFIVDAFDRNYGFKVSHNGFDVVIPPKAINSTEFDVIKMFNEQKTKNSLLDYMIKLNVDYTTSNVVLDGSNVTAPVVSLKIDLVGTNAELVDWDNYLLEYIDTLLKTPKYSSELKAHIKKLLKEKRDATFIRREINSYFDLFKDDFSKKLKSDMSKISKRSYTSNNFNSNIVIAYPFENSYVPKGYKFNINRWVPLDVIDYASKKAVQTNEVGVYTFAGRKVVINNSENLANGTKTTDLIAKYGLDDYFGKSGNINLKAPVKNYMVIGSLARLCGASKTADPVEFFKTKGVVFNSRTLNKNVTIQEGIYNTMKAYEIISKKKIDNIKIRNYKKTSGIKGISSKYKKAVQASFELGIFNDENMSPNASMTVQQFLDMITNLAKKTNI